MNQLNEPNNGSKKDLQQKNSDLILAVFENERTRSEIGIAAIDLKFLNLILSQFNDNQFYSSLLNKIDTINPDEILISTSIYKNMSLNHLKEFLENNFPNKKITLIKSRFFNKKNGFEYLSKICIVDFKNLTDLFSKSLALASCSALFKYSEYINKFSFSPHSVHLNLEGNEKLTQIDSNTSRYLELIYNTRNYKSSNNLFGILNYTKTKNGMRALRSSVLQPPCDLEIINARANIVENMIKDTDFYTNLTNIIKNFNCLEDVVSFVYQVNKKKQYDSIKATENKIQNILNMKHILESLKDLKNIIESSDFDIIKNFFDSLYEENKFENLNMEINKIIEDGLANNKNPLSSKIHKCFAIKANVNGLLDVARRNYSEIIQEIQIYTDELSNETQLPIKYAFNLTRGFFLHISLAGKNSKTKLDNTASSIFSTLSIKLIENLPRSFLKVTKTSNTVQFTTEKFLKLNEKANSSIEDIYFISNNIIDELVSNLKDNFDAFFKLKEFLSLLDLQLSLANYALNLTDKAKPVFSDRLILENSKHPVLLNIKDNLNIESRTDNLVLTSEKLIDNSIKINDKTPFILLTGANMSGKSTFLKQIGNLQIMSQCGSFLPSSSAILNIKRHILSLSGDYSDLNGIGYSSFQQEMNDINNIIQNLENDSLLLIDELCRSTNYYEGLALSFSICEYLLNVLLISNKKNIYIIFATHFKELSYLETCYSNIKTYHLESLMDNNQRLNHTFKLERGVFSLENYGYKLVEVSSLPEQIKEDSKMLLKLFNKNLDHAFKKNSNDLKKQLVFDLSNDLYELYKILDDLSDPDLINIIENLIQKFEFDYCNLGEM